MATIQTMGPSYQNTADEVASALNANFGALNTDKIEAADTQTLTNKTIDADNNTLSNIEVDNIKSSSKSGDDTTLITGTAGSADNLAKFNADGDLVDAGVAVLDEDSMASNSSSAVPTQQSTKAYVDSAIAGIPNTTTFIMTFVSEAQGAADTSPTTAYDSADATQYIPQTYLNSTGYQAHGFINVPAGATITAELVCNDNAGTGVGHNITVETLLFTDGSNLPSSTASSQSYSHTFTGSEVDYHNVSTAFSSLASGDYFVRVFSDTSGLQCYFIKFTLSYS